ncbi:MAG: hypothetical protein WBF79_07810 [Rhodococcus sp. (in: high G+C Gram-positive bacteria)]
MTAVHEPARRPWPDGLHQHLIEQCDGFSPLMSRAIAEDRAAGVLDRAAGIHNRSAEAPADGHQAASMDSTDVMFRKIRGFAREFLWWR